MPTTPAAHPVIVVAVFSPAAGGVPLGGLQGTLAGSVSGRGGAAARRWPAGSCTMARCGACRSVSLRCWGPGFCAQTLWTRGRGVCLVSRWPSRSSGRRAERSGSCPSSRRGPRCPTGGDRAQPLSIIHHQPVGAEQTPPAISVTFNQPMVPITKVGNLSGPAPIRVEPEVPGEWKWQGTTTLQLMPKERLRLRNALPRDGASDAEGAERPGAGQDFVYSFDTLLPAVTQTQPSSGSTEVGPGRSFRSGSIRRSAVKRSRRGCACWAKTTRRFRVFRCRARRGPRIRACQGYAQELTMAAFTPAQALRPNSTYRLQVAAESSGMKGRCPAKIVRSDIYDVSTACGKDAELWRLQQRIRRQ